MEYRMETDDANKSKMPGAGHARHPNVCCHRPQVVHMSNGRLPLHALFEQTHLHADLRTRTTNYVRSTLQQRANRTKVSSSPADCRCARSMGSLEAWPSLAVYSS